jgi:predicted nucleotide-binding protein
VHSGNKRNFPNPNVCFELGYAISVLTQARTLLLFHQNKHKLVDMPFDFSHYRTCPFEMAENHHAKLSKTLQSFLKNKKVRSHLLTNLH